eukprot:CAMPEP_0171327934 /NCGR_PEP_ID=MMETSP0878-20121228/340_1 /TAXON_ID=67004 /ORGANISM="Thalassiosira weissflogii, Strain CCMP1336" /LENGTH=174 /DNA_ID=CAMNT_0011827749 /DNA_START=9 /DNA_END=533 /DNA_ORIENTATION=+
MRSTEQIVNKRIVHRNDNETRCTRLKTRVKFSKHSSLAIFRNKKKDERLKLWNDKDSIRISKYNVAINVLNMRAAGLNSAIEELAHFTADLSSQNEKEIILPEELVGIERHISIPVSNMLFHRRRLAKLAVLREQAMQKQLGVFDPDRLAEVSKKSTEFSRTWAFVIANSYEES